MKRIRICAAIIITCAMLTPSVFAAKQKTKTGRVGNTEIVESEKKGKTEYRIVYTYEGD